MGRLAHRSHLAGFLALLVACGAEQRADEHARGNASPARRIVSLSPAVTELLFALGVGDRVVGRTTWCDYPPEARGVPSVGDGLNPNLEAIVARRPDLVVLYRSPLNETAAGRLRGLGIATAVLPQDRLEDLAADARTLGALAGREAMGDSLAGAILRVATAPAADLGVTLAFVVWDNPPMVIGAASYLDQLAALAGARNVFHDLETPSSVVSLETIASRDPDVLVALTDSEGAPLPPFTRRREWRVIRAIRERHVIVLAGSLFGRPSPRAAVAVAKLRRRLEGTR